MIRLSKCSLGKREKEAVCRVLDEEFLGMGPVVREFEEDLSSYFGLPAVCVVNGTAALQVALEACGIGKDDEVIVPSLTYLATFQAITASGASPVACDIRTEDLNICPKKAEELITPKTRAIMVVHYAGRSCDLDSFRKLAKKYNLRLIEDAAHALGSKYKGVLIGSETDVACFSFDGIKNITSGEGGCIVSSDLSVIKLAQEIRLLAVNGDTQNRFQKERSWAPLVSRQGWRYHMSDVFAAIGRVQLERLDEFVSIRTSVANEYLRLLRGHEEVVECVNTDFSEIAPHIFPVRLKDPLIRDSLRLNLLDLGIQTGIHYFPNHMLDFFATSKRSDLDVAELAWSSLLTLPLHVDLTLDDAEYVVESLIRCVKSQLH